MEHFYLFVFRRGIAIPGRNFKDTDKPIIIIIILKVNFFFLSSVVEMVLKHISFNTFKYAQRTQLTSHHTETIFFCTKKKRNARLPLF